LVEMPGIEPGSRYTRHQASLKYLSRPNIPNISPETIKFDDLWDMSRNTLVLRDKIGGFIVRHSATFKAIATSHLTDETGSFFQENKQTFKF